MTHLEVMKLKRFDNQKGTVMHVVVRPKGKSGIQVPFTVAISSDPVLIKLRRSKKAEFLLKRFESQEMSDMEILSWCSCTRDMNDITMASLIKLERFDTVLVEFNRHVNSGMLEHWRNRRRA